MIRVGEHKWDDCQRHSGRVYNDRSVGTVCMMLDPVPGEKAYRFSCWKCAKSWPSLEAALSDPEVYSDPDDLKAVVENLAELTPPPAPGDPVYRPGEQIPCGRIYGVLGVISAGNIEVFEIVPGWKTGHLVVYVRREIVRVGRRRSAFVLCGRGG